MHALQWRHRNITTTESLGFRHREWRVRPSTLNPAHTNYSFVIMGTMVCQITSSTIVYSAVYSGADQRKHQSSASLAFVRGINRWSVISQHKGPVTRKMFPFGDVTMQYQSYSCEILLVGACGLKWVNILLYPSHNEVVWGVYWFHSVRPSVCPSVRPSRMPCPLCIIYSYGWILFILGTNDHYHERVCRAPWPLTLTYIFKVIWPWLRKSCPLYSVYSSGWILPIFGTNDHYH